MRRNNTFRAEEHELSFWQSYSDMMAAMLLVFVLVLSGTLLQTQKVFEEKQRELSEQQELIEQQQDRINKIIGVRGDIVDALKTEFGRTNLSISVDSQTGSITFDSNLLFETDKSDLSPEGKQFLKEFLPKYFDAILTDEFKDYIAEIIIEGHTDTDGGYMYNLQLSQNRALAVASYCLSDDQNIFSAKERDDLRKIITANGKSWSDPVCVSDSSNVDKNASRRVEIKFRLKDDEMVKEMADILGE
ncbi:MAG: OmpA family protein [Lachnospiraceae bacterium]|nr:OmpA family protein [bacterium]MDY2598875.1 OmpA family protein [Lachnospiraceae bacterium]